LCIKLVIWNKSILWCTVRKTSNYTLFCIRTFQEDCTDFQPSKCLVSLKSNLLFVHSSKHENMKCVSAFYCTLYYASFSTCEPYQRFSHQNSISISSYPHNPDKWLWQWHFMISYVQKIPQLVYSSSSNH
jgi:hypothetical protein